MIVDDRSVAQVLCPLGCTTEDHQQVLFSESCYCRLFNPVTLTEGNPLGLHDVTGAVELPEDNWFFYCICEIPEGMEISVNEKGEPILIEIKPSQVDWPDNPRRGWYLIPSPRRYLTSYSGPFPVPVAL